MIDTAAFKLPIRPLAAVLLVAALAVACVVGGCSDDSNKSAPKQSSSTQNLSRSSEFVPPVRRTAGTESELAKCENLARQKSVRLSGGLKASNLGGEMHRYGANATYRGRSCQFVCLFWGGEMDSAACMHSSGVGQDELFCAHPPCFR